MNRKTKNRVMMIAIAIELALIVLIGINISKNIKQQTSYKTNQDPLMIQSTTLNEDDSLSEYFMKLSNIDNEN